MKKNESSRLEVLVNNDEKYSKKALKEIKHNLENKNGIIKLKQKKGKNNNE